MARGVPLFFDPQWYLQIHADVAQAGMDPLRHFRRYGHRERRQFCASRAVSHERDLAWGMLDQGVTRLEAIIHDPHASRAEQVQAIIAVARFAAQNDDWSQANALLCTLQTEIELVRGYATHDTSLLAIEAAVVVGQFDRARRIWELANRWLTKSPDLRLALANIIGARNSRGWQRALRPLYWRYGLRTPSLDWGNGTSDGFSALVHSQAKYARQYGPKVSIIMPAYNAAKTIDVALRSLLAQTYGHLEIIVVDNGSTDSTSTCVAVLAQRDPRIRCISAPDAPGAYAARNLGLRAATGDLMTVLDADDWAHPQRIARQVRSLQNNQKHVGVLTHTVRVTSDLRFTHGSLNKAHLHPDMSSLMIRASLRDTLGEWDRVYAGADSEYMERLKRHYGDTALLQILPGVPMSFARKHSASLTGSEATHIRTHIYGPRRSYSLAARRWHTSQGVNLHLPLEGNQRPFPAPAVLAVSDPPAVSGYAEHLTNSGIFDDTWMMTTYPDLRAENLDALDYYLTQGAAEARDPGPRFSTSGYTLWRGVDMSTAWQHALDDPDPSAWLPTWTGERPRQDNQPHAVIFGHRALASLFGAERGLLHVVDQAYASGVSASVVLPHIANPDFLEKLCRRCNAVHIRPYGWHYAGVHPHPETLDVLTDLLRKEAPDQIHQMTCVLDAPLFAAQKVGIPSTLHLREQPALDPWLCYELGTTAPALREHLLRHTNRFCSVSDGGLEWLDAPDRCLRWHNRAEPALESLTYKPGTPPRIAMIGSLTRRKGLHDMVALAQAALRDGLSAEFLLIGPDSEDLRALGRLPANLRHTGYVTGPVEAMQLCDIVVNLSHMSESHGMTIHEALLSGRPVVVYSRGSLPHLLDDSKAGICVPADDVAAVLKALKNILAGDLETWSRAARARGNVLQTRALQGNKLAFVQK